MFTNNVKHRVFYMLFGLENRIKQDENIGLNFIVPCLSSPLKATIVTKLLK